MTTVVPPPPAPPPSGGSVPAPQVTATITQMPPVIAKLPIESLLNGIIRPPTPQGEAVLQTPQGPVTFKAPFVLPQGAQVSFKIIQVQPIPQMQLTQINGQAVPPQAGVQKLGQLGIQLPTSFTNNAAQTPAQAVQTTPLPNVQNVAQGMKAWVLSQATPPNIQQQQTPQSPVNTPIQNAFGQANQPAVQTASGQVPAQANSTAPKTTPPTVTNPTSPAQNTTATVQTASAQTGQAGQNVQNQMFQQGNQLSVRLLSVQNPGQPINVTSPNPPPSTNTVITQGQVQGTSAQGQPIVKIPQGIIMLDTEARFPDNSTLRLEVISSQKPQAQATNPALKAMAPHGMQNLTQSWPALEEALVSLKTTNPVLADQMLNQLIPKPDMKLAANMLFFLKALGRGVPIKNWTEENIVRALSRTKPELLNRLEEDFANLSQKANQPNATDWKIAFVPMQGENLHQIRLAHREPDEETEDGKEDPGVRFVIDLELSKLGPIQLDGLAKDRHKKFDLIFRTKSALPGHMRHDIHNIFEEGMAVIGFEGKITYQVTPNFVKVDGGEMAVSKLNFGMIV